MNREIKFRIWDNHTKRYKTCVYESHRDCYLFIGRSGYVTAFNCYGEEIDFEDGRFAVQQYTGLKDSKGVEIYEGDIVEIGDRKKEVIFNIGMFYIDENYGDIVPISEVDNIIKVIGNIFENPELIKNNE
jgi:uncharacterized phage protein (TIGR01671 family)